MAFQSEAAPPVVGEAHKDTYDGDTKSEDETEEEEDLEEGEILDSGNELEEDVKIEVLSPNTSSSKSASDHNSPKKTIENSKFGQSSSKQDPGMNKNDNEKDFSNKKYMRKLQYVDHDQASDNDNNEKEEKESSWYKRVSRKKSGSADGPIDYRKELEMYAGTPPSSPERDDNGEVIKKKKRGTSSKSKSKKLAKRTKRKLLEKKSGKKSKFMIRRPCKFYMEGGCSKGEDCPFLHIRPRDQRKRELCRYYLNGFCHKGNQCTFMHSEFPCKFFHTGAKCFSGENCRFSHKPLTEETKRLLQECLKGYDPDGPRNKRNRSKSPEPLPMKRICLLGSPPRHIREAEETKRWQEEMELLNRKKNHDAFQISLSSPSRQPPPQNSDHFSRPNFYVDTMKQSPTKSERWHAPQDDRGGGDDFDQHNNNNNNHLDNQHPHDQDMRPNVNWTNICALVESMKEPREKDQVDFTDEPDFEEDDSNSFIINKELPDQLKTNKPFEIDEEDFKANDNSTSGSQEAESIHSTPPRVPSPSDTDPSADVQDTLNDPNPIQIPSHLPRMQRELLLRIQRHQKVKSTNDDDSEETIKTEAVDISEPVAISKNEEYEDKEMWSSSDDDDDDADKPLTDVLKKLRQMPPPKPKEIRPQKPPMNISQMLSTIMQKATENNKGSNIQEQGNFWQNILTGAVLPEKPAPTNSRTLPGTSNSPPPPSSQITTKRRVLLPDPKPAEKSGVLESRDPRLKSRDPRVAPQKPPVAFPLHNTFTNNPPPPLPIPMLKLEPMSVNSHLSHHSEVNSILASQTSAVIVDGRAANVPYKLYTITCMPLNYTRYVQASQSDPKLANDPRLRKYLSQEPCTVLPPSLASAPEAVSKAAVLPDLPLFANFKIEKVENYVPEEAVPKATTLPDLPLFTKIKKEKVENYVPQPEEVVPKAAVLPDLPLFTNFKIEKMENYVPQPLQEIVSAEMPELRIKGSGNVDPRTKRAERLLGNCTPPHLVAESPLPPPNTTITPPMLASHLPRAMADPRMAKLHKPIDPRRSRTVSEAPQKQVPLLNKPHIPSPVFECKIEKIESSDSQPHDQSNDIHTSEKKKLDESKKNKAIHRNRKSSMDYASPLNSCDGNLTGSLNYNKRPKSQPRNNTVDVPIPKESLSPVVNLVSSLVPDFSTSDNISLEYDSVDTNASLKDMFKTIDPTASPFC